MVPTPLILFGKNTTCKRGKLIGGGRNKTENRPKLGCRFSFEVRSSDWPAQIKQKLVGFNDIPPLANEQRGALRKTP